MLAKIGFEALATTSAGYRSPRACRTTGSAATGCSRTSPRSCATDLPVNADLETASAMTRRRREDDPARGRDRHRGRLIEDSIDRPGEKVYDIGLAADRVRAAARQRDSTPSC
jgi:2-methylisocitrate lyase-like PEP mutase family enzyme